MSSPSSLVAWKRPDAAQYALLAPANTAAKALPEDQLTFIDGKEREQRFHWAEVYRRARCAAGSLANAGVKPGDIVGIILPTEPAFIDALFGCQLLGAVPVLLYLFGTTRTIEEYHARTAAMLEAVAASAVITSGRVKRVLGKVIERYRPPLGLIDATPLSTGIPSTVAPPAPTISPWQFSSGTTVAPKPVALTHRQVLANVEAIVDFLPLMLAEQGGVSWLPLYHDMGLIGCVFVALVGPGPLALIPPEQFLAKPELWLRAISRARRPSLLPNFAMCAERIGRPP